MKRYSYDRRNELLVIEPVQFLSSSKQAEDLDKLNGEQQLANRRMLVLMLPEDFTPTWIPGGLRLLVNQRGMPSHNKNSLIEDELKRWLYKDFVLGYKSISGNKLLKLKSIKEESIHGELADVVTLVLTKLGKEYLG